MATGDGGSVCAGGEHITPSFICANNFERKWPLVMAGVFAKVIAGEE